MFDLWCSNYLGFGIFDFYQGFNFAYFMRLVKRDYNLNFA